MEERPNYYAIIPANVRYDSELTPNAKLLYGEISALSNKYGYCFATNEYFAQLYSFTTRTITDLIKKLEDKGYIETFIETKRFENGTIKKERKISINHIEVSQQNHIEDLPQNHIEENFSYNNTSNNNYINNKKRFIKPTIQEINDYARENNLTLDAEYFIDYYESKGWVVGKTPMKNWKSAIRNWCRNNKKYDNTPKDTTSTHFEWVSDSSGTHLERVKK